MEQGIFSETFFRTLLLAGCEARARLRKICLAAALTFLPGLTNAGAFYDLQALQASVTSYLQEYYKSTPAVKVEITVGNLDRRLQLANCDQPLSMKVNDASNAGGNLTVHARCEGTTPWAIYVPAQVSLFRELLLASRNLVRGDIVTQADVVSEVVNISQLRQGQIGESDNIIGQEVRRPISKGEPFRSAALDSPMVVRRGDPVTIELQAGPIAVRSNGTAMANGRIGESIRVRNSQSDRIVNARVVSAGRVLTVM